MAFTAKSTLFKALAIIMLTMIMVAATCIESFAGAKPVEKHKKYTIYAEKNSYSKPLLYRPSWSKKKYGKNYTLTVKTGFSHTYLQSVFYTKRSNGSGHPLMKFTGKERTKWTKKGKEYINKSKDKKNLRATFKLYKKTKKGYTKHIGSISTNSGALKAITLDHGDSHHVDCGDRRKNWFGGKSTSRHTARFYNLSKGKYRLKVTTSDNLESQWSKIDITI